MPGMGETEQTTKTVATWLAGFTGGGKPADEWEPSAQSLVDWLADKGYSITRTD